MTSLPPSLEPHYSDSTITLYHQPEDGFSVLASLPDASVDAVCTDPPYLLGFMGRQWDSHREINWHESWTRECLRVLKPGGHMLAFGGTRTWHRLACAIEDAGFEVRDSIAWMYGSGFPKSLDVSKAIDRQRHDADDKLRVTTWLADVADRNGVTRADVDAHMGTSDMGGWWLSRLRHRCAVPTLDQVPNLLEVLKVTPDDVPDEIRALLIDLNGMKGQPGPAWFAREVMGRRTGAQSVSTGRFGGWGNDNGKGQSEFDLTAPATDAARTWQGWGTALKPAFEPIVVARKPLVGTVAANVLAHGTGALNIDACRVETDDPLTGSGKPPLAHGGMNSRPFHATHEATPTVKNPAGRWPANVVLDESQAEALDEQSGESVTPSKVTRGASLAGKDGATARSGGAMERRENVPCHGDSGGASRFFYVAREDEACLDDASGTATHGATDPAPSAAGASWSAPVESGISTRFTYTAKAATDERVRVNGVAHPTVKPLTLMRWLVRLVTPPGGTVLEPFAGSGTTVEACILEGFRCVAIEREADYLPLIRQRIHRRRDPVQAVKVAGDDGGLFDLLDGGAA